MWNAEASRHQQPSTSSHSTSAFTLIELLVVVAIIALLVSILLPTLSKAREQTRRVVCATNLHHWSLMLNIYANENRGRYPRGGLIWEGTALAPMNVTSDTEAEMRSLPWWDWFGYDDNWDFNWTATETLKWDRNNFVTCPNLAKLGHPYPAYFNAGLYVLEMGYGYCGDGTASGANWRGWPLPNPYPESHAPVGPSDPGEWNLMHDLVYAYDYGDGIVRVADVAHLEGGGGWWRYAGGQFAGAGFYGNTGTNKREPAGGNQLYNDGSVIWANFNEMVQIWGYWVYR